MSPSVKVVQVKAQVGVHWIIPVSQHVSCDY